MITIISSRHWKKITALLGIEEPIATLEAQLGLDFAKDEGARFDHRAELFPLFERTISAYNYLTLAEKLESEGLVWGPYRTVYETARDPFTVSENPLFTNIMQPSGHEYPVAGAPGTLSGVERGDARPASLLGTHTEEVFLDYLKMSPKTFGEMVDKDILAVAKDDSL